MVDSMATAAAVTLNVDVWSSKRQRGYIGITVHFVDDQWKPRHFLLGCPRFTGNHTAEAILDLVMLVIDDFKLKKKVYFVGTDNGANIVKAFEGWLPGFMWEGESAESREEDDDMLTEERACLEDMEFDSQLTEELQRKLQLECPQARFALSDRSIVVNHVNGSFFMFTDAVFMQSID